MSIINMFNERNEAVFKELMTITYKTETGNSGVSINWNEKFTRGTHQQTGASTDFFQVTEILFILVQT